MIIKLKCNCGATFAINDEQDRFINGDTKPDENGHRYVAQQQAREFQVMHASCMMFEDEEFIEGQEVIIH